MRTNTFPHSVRVERLHIEMRNKRVLRNFPMDNLEPAVIQGEIEDLERQRESRRTVARILGMLAMRMNIARAMESRRKQRLVQPCNNDELALGEM